MSDLPRMALVSSPTPEIAAEINRAKARDRIAPGWGIDQRVVSVVAQSRRIVVVEEVYYTLDLSVTVHDFLLEFMKEKLGPAWGTAELAKPYPSQSLGLLGVQLKHKLGGEAVQVAFDRLDQRAGSNKSFPREGGDPSSFFRPTKLRPPPSRGQD